MANLRLSFWRPISSNTKVLSWTLDCCFCSEYIVKLNQMSMNLCESGRDADNKGLIDVFHMRSSKHSAAPTEGTKTLIK